MTRLIQVMCAVFALALGGFLLTGQSSDDLPVNPLIGAAVAQESGGAGEADQALELAEQAQQAIVEMAIGAEDAPVTMIEYASFTCPHCANFHSGPFKQIKKDYIDTGKVRFIFREAYFDRYGLWASMIARCEPSKYFGVTDLIFEGQSDWARAGDPVAIVDALRKIGRVAGIDNAKLETCLKDADKAQALVSWYQANMEEHKISGTPAFFINGDAVENQNYAGFKAAIDAKLAE